MADENGAIKVVRTFRFNIYMGDSTEAIASCSEVSGFDATYDVLEYRAGDDMNITPSKFPGLLKYGNITIKRAILTGDTTTNLFYSKIKDLRDGKINEKFQLTISLMDDTGANAVATWVVSNAWVCKYTGPDLNASAGEVAVETIEIAHEGVERTV